MKKINLMIKLKKQRKIFSYNFHMYMPLVYKEALKYKGKLHI